jgi:hypothetical protein
MEIREWGGLVNVAAVMASDSGETGQTKVGGFGLSHNGGREKFPSRARWRLSDPRLPMSRYASTQLFSFLLADLR